jgi:hypothetical protein
MPRLTPKSSYILAANSQEREKQERLSYQEFLSFYDSPYRSGRFHCFEGAAALRPFAAYSILAGLDVA